MIAIDVATLTVAGNAIGKPLAWIAYTMVEAKPWGLGYVAFVEQRWSEVATALGMTHEQMLPALRPMFRDQFNERCAAFVRAKFGLPQ